MAADAAQSENRSEQRFWSWLLTNRVTIGLAGLIAFLTAFYVEEDIRGKMAWKRCRRQLHAIGQMQDWDALVPPRIPDAENIFSAPKINDWFVKGGSAELTKRMSFSALSTYLKEHAPDPLARIIIVPPDSTNSHPEADIVLRYRFPLLSLARGASGAPPNEPPAEQSRALVYADPDVKERLTQLMRGAIGSNDLVYLKGPQEIILVRNATPIKPFRILLLANQTPSPTEVRQFFPADALKMFPSVGDLLTVQADTTNSLTVLLTPHESTAADYLGWSDQFQGDFALIREALKRPSAHMEGEYSQPFSIPIVNFVAIRTVAQTIAQRAQCYLLLGQPDNALRELKLLHDLNRLMHTTPTTLVAAMIEVAVTGLYTEIVADGFRLGAWREPQLAALAGQLGEVNLLPQVRAALLAERAGVCRLLESQSAANIQSLTVAPAPKTLWQRLQDPKTLLLPLAPHGWNQQNMVVVAKLNQKYLDAFDAEREVISPRQLDASMRDVQASFIHINPQNFLAAICVPNFNRACQRLAQTQTMVNEANVACALERYRVVHGDFPETLDLLVPGFIQKLPADVIGGQPLRYRRKSPDNFLLYSVGWNETDDGGVCIRNENGSVVLDQGDWPWDPLQDRK